MIDSLLHGWSGVAFAFSAVEVPLLAGLARGRSAYRHYFLSPLVAAPLTAIVAGGVGLSSFGLAHVGFSHHGLLQWTVGTALSTYLGYRGGRAIAESREEQKSHQRGSFIAPVAPARDTVLRANDRARDAALSLAGTRIPVEDEAKHFKLIGATGTGKSTAIQEIVAGALARGDRAVIADPDGGYLRRFYRPDRGDIVLNPFDERSVKWDLFAEIKNGYDVEQLARSMIPDHEGQDRSWRGYARTFFAAVMRQMHEAGAGDTAELYRLLVIADSAELRGLVRGTPAQPFLDEHNARMFDSIRSVTSSAVGSLQYVARQKASDFSVREWVKSDSPGVLFIPYKAGQIASLRSTISAWMRLAIFETMDQDVRTDAPPCDRGRDPDSRLWFVVDELDALGQIDGLKDALARLRKFGGRCVLGFQSVAQVSSTYGHDEAHTIVENCGNTLILRCSASEGGGTARFASQLIGEREVLHTTVSRSRRPTEFFTSVTRSEHRSVEATVLASQIEQLPDLAGYLKYASNPVWQQVRLDATRAWEQHRLQQAAPAGAGPAHTPPHPPERTRERGENE